MVFSLTGPGKVIAEKLCGSFPELQHKHRPTDFKLTVQTDFNAGNDCIFICATGIVIRALAPVLTDKRTDPAVVVLDESGKFVIPLLSGHEGGAGALAQQIAEVLDAQSVVTSSTDYGRPIYTIGIGCDRGCPVEHVKELIELARKYVENLTGRTADFSALSSIDIKSAEKCLLELASTLEIPFKTYSAQQLRIVEDQLTVHSDIVFSEVGCYGVAEAAALLSATEVSGIDSELLMPKHKNKRATIAVARSYLQ